METKLLRASIEDAEQIHKMQVEAFMDLFNKYHDYDTSPATETIDKVIFRLKQKFTYYYFIYIGDQKVGAIRIVDKKEPGKNKRISPIFVMPDFQGQGIAQRAIELCEEIHGRDHWELVTILQEPKNCYLYEKMGYTQNGNTKIVNDKLTLVVYEK